MTQKTAGRGSVRCNALDLSGLDQQEKHGKRLDKSSASRVVRLAPPLWFGSLDLRSAYDQHMSGVRQNAGAKKPILHFLVTFPTSILDGADADIPAPFRGLSREDRQKLMGSQAAEFINKVHGGKAVFAGRVDRDEAGETIVDVFAAPRYEKRTKRTPPDKPGEIWASATKFGRQLAEQHQAEIRRRHPKAAEGLLTGPRMVGIALQSEFAAFFEKKNGMPLTPKREKASSESDRLEAEAWRRIETDRVALGKDIDALAAQRAALDNDRATLDADRVLLDQDREMLATDRTALDSDRAALNADGAVLASAAEAFVHNRTALAKDRAALDADRTSLDQDRIALSQDAQALAADRAALVKDLAHVDTLRDRLSYLAGHVEKYLRVVLAFAPRVRRVLRDAEASNAERDAAASARRDIIEVVPELRLSQTQIILAMSRDLRLAPEEPSELVEDTETPGIDGP